MSILTENHQIDPPITPEIEVARLKYEAKMAFEYLRNIVYRSTKTFWQNEKGFTPEQMATAAGSSGAELFTLHSLIATVLEQSLPGSAAEIVSLVGQHTINQDGTITIIQPEPPEEVSPEDLNNPV